MKENKCCVKNEEKKNISVVISYGDKSLVECMKNVLSKRIIQNNK